MKIFHLVFASIILFSCSKNDSTPAPSATVPTLTTGSVGSITNATASAGGTISSDGGSAITARGVCWSTSANPVITGNHTTDGTGAGTFTSNISGLTATTLYYVRAYAMNATGTAYGNEISFTTSATTGSLPSVTTSAISSITTTTASGGGNVTNDGGSSVTARGVCWNTSSNPVIINNHTTNGSGLGNFTSAMSSLTPSTIYYVRAYATNTNGTAYGNEVSFTTAAVPGLPTVTTSAIGSITTATASGGGNVLTDGGLSVTARGICWSAATNPIVSGSHTTDGSGLGVFTSSMSSLASSTTYYVRAYATNSLGTAYGNQISFSTTTPVGHVYVGGYESNGTKKVAKIWDNGVPSSITSGTYDAQVAGLAASGADLYAFGSEGTATVGLARLWKNGTSVPLTFNGTGSISYGGCVSGTDVYVAGSDRIGGYQSAQVWKNGVEMPMTNSINYEYGFAVAVAGADVYLIGDEVSSFILAKFWKNGTPTYLSSVTSHANGIFINATDVYIVGNETNGTKMVAKIWKNGVASSLTNGLNDACAEAGFISGTDTYIVGWENNGTKKIAKIWKNGVATSLTNGTNDALAESIAVVGSDVYVTGVESNGTKNVVMVWKNGIGTPLTDGTKDAYGWWIIVK